jgi:hypothetical protein
VGRGRHIIPKPEKKVDIPRQSDYRQEYCELVCQMAEEGKFPEEWCAELGCTMSTLYVWANKYEDFEWSVEVAWHLLHAHYARQMREGVTDKRGMPALLEILRKRFPETCGQNPRNTETSSRNRNRNVDMDVDRPGDGARDVTPDGCDGGPTSSREALEQRVEELILRRRYDDGSGRPKRQGGKPAGEQ